MTDFVKDFMGYNFIWFIGEVEDRDDPLKLGRVKIRCFGWHSTDKDKQPTIDLPWASTVQPVTAPAASASGLTVGTWVFGFFMDGESGQRPMVTGQIPGYRFDENGLNGESELPRAARVEEGYPSAQSELRKQKRTKDITKDKSSDHISERNHFLQTIDFLEPNLKYTDDCGFPAPQQHLNLMTRPGGMREAA